MNMPKNQDAPTILVVDDDEAVGTVLSAIIQQGGMNAEAVLGGPEALQRLERRPYEAVITDLRMPGIDGMTLLRRIRRRWPDTPVVMLTAHGSVDMAVEAMKLGAAEFMLKPFDREEILQVVRRVTRAAARTSSQPPPAPARPGEEIVGESPVMEEVRQLIKRAAASRANVLIRGESGTGKELVARAVHHRSQRAEHAMVTVNCAGLPSALLESELFGYEKGAFTGASCRKPGRVELAQGGTLFLDEIGDVPVETQVKLLRVLSERTFERLGGTRTMEADVRFITATHRPLEQMFQGGGFREDLFYRLNVIPIWLPPLRQRGAEEIRALALTFCARFTQQNSRPELVLTEEALRVLGEQPWPGNVRQLLNLVERLVVLCDGPDIGPDEVLRELEPPSQAAPAVRDPDRVTGPEEPALEQAPPVERLPPRTLEQWRREAEREALERTLTRCDNNRTRAARVLQISRRTLYNKLSEHGLDG